MSAAEIAAGNRLFMEAVARRDVDTMTNLFTIDAMLLPQGAEVVSGREAIRQTWERMVASGLVAVSLTSLAIEILGDIATDVGYESLSLRPPGAAASTIEGKYLAVWKKIDGRWLVHRDMFNTSAPAR